MEEDRTFESDLPSEDVASEEFVHKKMVRCARKTAAEAKFIQKNEEL